MVEEKDIVQDYLNSLLGVQPKPETTEAPTPESQSADETLTLMVFRRGVLKLGLPVTCLSGIQTLEGFVQPLQRAPNWVTGKAVDNTPIMLLVDAQKLIMPDKPAMGPEAAQDCSVVSVLEGRMGLVTDEICGAQRIRKSAVQWRREPGSRPWLSGIVSEDRCLILDPEAIMQLLRAR